MFRLESNTYLHSFPPRCYGDTASKRAFLADQLPIEWLPQMAAANTGDFVGTRRTWAVRWSGMVKSVHVPAEGCVCGISGECIAISWLFAVFPFMERREGVILNHISRVSSPHHVRATPRPLTCTFVTGARPYLGSLWPDPHHAASLHAISLPCRGGMHDSKP